MQYEHKESSQRDSADIAPNVFAHGEDLLIVAGWELALVVISAALVFVMGWSRGYEARRSYDYQRDRGTR